MTRPPRPGVATRLARAAATFAAFACIPHAGAEDVREFDSDTPGKGYTPHTVAQGYLQVESDIFHIVEMDGTRLIETLDPVLKYGFSDDVDIEIETSGLLDQSVRTGGRTIHMTGFGDVTPAIKWGVLGNDSEALSVAIRGGVKFPTAAAGLGNGAVEYFLSVPVEITLPLSLTLQGQEEVDLLKNQTDTGKHFEYSETASLGRSFGRISLSAELFAQSGTDPNSHALYTADLGAGFSPTSTTIVTFGTYFGLNSAAPGIEAYTAFAFRF